MTETHDAGHAHTPRRSIRIPDDLWAYAHQCAQVEHTTVTAYIVRALRQWRPTPMPAPPDPESRT
jgi:hypothetical protein